jgi:hypothetical protein
MDGHTLQPHHTPARYSSLTIMKFSTTTSGLVLASLSRSVLAGATYSLSDSIVGEGFYSAFNFEAIADPTYGRV